MPATAAAAALTLLAVQYAIFSSARPEPVERVARAMLAARQNEEPVATYHAFVRNLIFYTRLDMAQQRQ